MNSEKLIEELNGQQRQAEESLRITEEKKKLVDQQLQD